MKNVKYIILVFSFGFLTVSCKLDLVPENGYNEKNISNKDGDSDKQYKTKDDIKGALENMYNQLKGNKGQELLLDLLVYTDVMSDNAYSGRPDQAEIYVLDRHAQDASNKNVARDWKYYMNIINDANQIITYIDDIEDEALTQKERDQWKAEAMIWRSYNWLEMSRLWGDIPMIEKAPPAITENNMAEVYPLYYPPRTPQLDAYNKIVADLEWAVQHAPEIDPVNKLRSSKAMGYGLLARLYSDKPIQDYNKVASFCEKVEGMGLTLVADYADLFSWNEAKNDAKLRHSSESIFEIPFSRSQGNWIWMMFWRNGISANPEDSFSWAKWVTPSRNLIKAFDDEGDNVRKNQSIIIDKCGWSTYYPNTEYAFMYKQRHNAASIIKMRLAEIYLLHAEALAHNGILTGDSGAEGYVNKIRARVNLPPLPSSATASKQAMLDAILKERRLELAFEGQRWFDLIRFGKAIECTNNVNNPSSVFYDVRKPQTKTIDETGLLLPVPLEQIELNKNLTQNKGY